MFRNYIALFLSIVLFLCAIALRLHSSEQAVSLVGPDLMATGNNSLYLHLNGSIYVFDQEGELLRTISLKQLDISILTAIQVQGQDLFVGENGGYIKRCSLHTLQCTILFSDKRISGAFKFSIENNIAYIADTHNHRIFVYDILNKRHLQTYDQGLQYPNQVLKSGDHLLVADTDHHRIVNLKISPDHRLGSPSEVVGAGTGCRFPVSFLNVQDQWWIMATGRSLQNGRINIVSKQGVLLDIIRLPEMTRPLFMGRLNDQIVVSDEQAFLVYAIDRKSRQINNFAGTEWQEKLADLKAEKGQLNFQSQLSMLLIMFSALLMIIYAGRDGVYKLQNKFKDVFQKINLTPIVLPVSVLSFHMADEFKRQIRLSLRILKLLPVLLFSIIAIGICLVWFIEQPRLILQEKFLVIVVLYLYLIPLTLVLASMIKESTENRLFFHDGNFYLLNENDLGMCLPLEKLYFTATHVMAGQYILPYRTVTGSNVIEGEEFMHLVVDRLPLQHRLNAGEAMVYQVMHMTTGRRLALLLLVGIPLVFINFLIYA